MFQHRVNVYLFALLSLQRIAPKDATLIEYSTATTSLRHSAERWKSAEQQKRYAKSKSTFQPKSITAHSSVRLFVLCTNQQWITAHFANSFEFDCVPLHWEQAKRIIHNGTHLHPKSNHADWRTFVRVEKNLKIKKQPIKSIAKISKRPKTKGRTNEIDYETPGEQCCGT